MARMSKQHSSSYSKFSCRARIKEEKGGPWSEGNPHTSRETGQKPADLMREADAVGELPGATAGDLNGPYGAHQQSKQAEVWQVAQQFA